jgi:4,5-DOPA dioxygenase extradiol
LKKPLPAIFLGHGNPMNSMAQNTWTEAWAAIGDSIPRPSAVLCISAHWYLQSTRITAMPRPRTIHDFYGFPRELYEVQYPAPGDPELARRVQQMLAPLPVALDEAWGLDHGAWSVLRHMYPDADVPILQLSIDETQPASFHYELGKKLAPLRDEGILIVGSGNLVHNIQMYAWEGQMPDPYDWAARFDTKARELILRSDYKALVDYKKLGPDALLSIPSPDHYLPLLYVLGSIRQGEAISFPVDGFDGGSMSMLAVKAAEDQKRQGTEKDIA